MPDFQVFDLKFAFSTLGSSRRQILSWFWSRGNREIMILEETSGFFILIPEFWPLAARICWFWRQIRIPRQKLSILHFKLTKHAETWESHTCFYIFGVVNCFVFWVITRHHELGFRWKWVETVPTSLLDLFKTSRASKNFRSPKILEIKVFNPKFPYKPLMSPPTTGHRCTGHHK